MKNCHDNENKSYVLGLCTCWLNVQVQIQRMYMLTECPGSDTAHVKDSTELRQKRNQDKKNKKNY